MAIADQIKTDLQGAMRAGEKQRVGALRLVLSELQKAAKEGGDDQYYGQLRLPNYDLDASRTVPWRPYPECTREPPANMLVKHRLG